MELLSEVVTVPVVILVIMDIMYMTPTTFHNGKDVVILVIMDIMYMHRLQSVVAHTVVILVIMDIMYMV